MKREREREYISKLGEAGDRERERSLYKRERERERERELFV